MCGVGRWSGLVVWCRLFGVWWRLVLGVFSGGSRSGVRTGRSRHRRPPPVILGSWRLLSAGPRWVCVVQASEVHLKEKRKKERKGLGAPAGPRIRRVEPSAKVAPVGPWRKARPLSDVCRAGVLWPARSGLAGIVRPWRPCLLCRSAGLRLLLLSSAAAASSVMFCVVHLSALWSGCSSVSVVGGSGAVVRVVRCCCVCGSDRRVPSVGCSAGLWVVCCCHCHLPFLRRWFWSACAICRRYGRASPRFVPSGVVSAAGARVGGPRGGRPSCLYHPCGRSGAAGWLGHGAAASVGGGCCFRRVRAVVGRLYSSGWAVCC